MTQSPGLTVTVAAYRELEDARLDEAALGSSAAPGEKLDVAVLERTLDEITGFQRGVSRGWGQGVLASAVCGALWPPCLVVGALAGGVGGRVMTKVREALSLEAIAALVGVLEKGTFVTVAVCGPPSAAARMALGKRAKQVATVPFATSVVELREALDGDFADD